MQSKEFAKLAVEWLRSKVYSADAKGLIFGLSGGLDSAVVAVLAKKAFPDNSLGVIMPVESAEEDIEDARMLAADLNLKTVEIDLNPVYQAFTRVLPPGSKLAYANLKPRIRMTVLYYLAKDLGYLVVGTGNKSEISVGYFTKHGDGAADLFPLAGIYKTDLYRIADDIGVPQKILNKSPSAGLWEGQTDEEEMGITYEELDTCLKFMEIGENPPFPEEVVNKVKHMVEKSSHKRQPALRLEIPEFD